MFLSIKVISFFVISYFLMYFYTIAHIFQAVTYQLVMILEYGVTTQEDLN